VATLVAITYDTLGEKPSTPSFSPSELWILASDRSKSFQETSMGSGERDYLGEKNLE